MHASTNESEADLKGYRRSPCFSVGEEKLTMQQENADYEEIATLIMKRSLCKVAQDVMLIFLSNIHKFHRY